MLCNQSILFMHVCVYVCVSVCVSRSVVSDSLRPHGLQPTRLLSPWDSPGKNTGVDCHSTYIVWVSPVTQMVKNLPAMKKTQVQSLGWEDPLEKGMVNSNTLAWRIPWTEETDGLQSMGSQGRTSLK